MSNQPVRALTVRQPWADAIVHGQKRTENRTWATKYRGIVLIHAAAALDRSAPAWKNRPDALEQWTAALGIDPATVTEGLQTAPAPTRVRKATARYGGVDVHLIDYSESEAGR